MLNLPNRNKAISSSTMPDIKHNNIAYAGPEFKPNPVWRLVIRAKRAVGPIVTCRQLPKKA